MRRKKRRDKYPFWIFYIVMAPFVLSLFYNPRGGWWDNPFVYVFLDIAHYIGALFIFLVVGYIAYNMLFPS
jgi:hypothetical protein